MNRTQRPRTGRMTSLVTMSCLVLMASAWPARQASGQAPSDPAATISYNRQIRAILSNNCFKCHGPDARQRKAGLRLDQREEALRPTESGRVVIVPKDSAQSELVKRIMSDDPAQVMPPPDSGKQLTPAEKDLLKNWIDQGANWQRHWSFIPPERPAMPAVQHADWVRNPIDAFVLARLEEAGLSPSTEADKVTLIRRLTLDLTGLPPTPQEVDDFLADDAPDAYSRCVERLLASPHHAERLALEWLDAARFADTHGYHIDSGRDMSRWREWVIESFQQNRPFDQFTVEQLAGDLLPEATLEQKIASGFNRNHMINFEGGAIPEEYHTAYIVDRVNTTCTVWLGLTVGCAQCHDHKYDPITQKDYYQLFAFFHNVPENGLDGTKGNAAPMIPTPSRAQQQELDRLASSIRDLEALMAGDLPEVDRAQATWEADALSAEPSSWTPLEPGEFKAASGAVLTRLEDRSLLASGENPATETYTITCATDLKPITALRVEALPDEHLSANGPGRSANGNVVLSDVRLALGDGTALKFKASSADFSQQDYPVTQAMDDQPQTGWAIFPEVGKPHHAIFELEQPLELAAGASLVVTLDFQSQFAQHQLGRFRISVTNSTRPHEPSALPAPVREALAIVADQRTGEQRALLRAYYREQVSDDLEPRHAELAELLKSQGELQKQIRTTMVMQEMDQPRDTFLLIRGQYDKHGEKVTPAVIANLAPLPAGQPANRLGLARWLVDRSQPLTARVAVNRYWQIYFGTGLVKTSEDFGSQGEWPSHPDLLDWLAVEFMESGWDVRHIQRLLVTSATYRQRSHVTPDLLSRDPENRLLARASRPRLNAEFIRDQALSVAGLLDTRIGGPSVSPYQPAGIWEDLASREDGANWTAQTYTQSHGADLYRRTMYTFWKRTSPPPTLATFDAPDRETCTVRRSRTNTPLQALILMNDPTYMEASRKLAERMLKEAGPEQADRVALGFRLVLARRPTEQESRVLSRVFEEQWAVFRQDPAAATKVLSIGEANRDETLDVAELGAWTIVANVLLNLDETLTRN